MLYYLRCRGHTPRVRHKYLSHPYSHSKEENMEEIPTKLPDSELAVMQAIWTLRMEGETQITAGLLLKRFPALHHYKLTTVLTLINRLLAKGFLTAEKNSRANCYTPLVDRDVYRRAVTKEYLRRMYLDDTDGMRADIRQICLECSAK